MKLIPYILNRIAFVRTELAADGSCRTEVFVWRREGLTSVDRSAAKNNLAAVVVCGHGVVSKPEGSELVTRVKADPDTFLWSAADGTTSFVRRERLGTLTEELAAAGIVPVRVFCTDPHVDFEKMAGEFARQLYAELHWRTLVRPTSEGSAAAQAVVRRAALPVLGVFLCLLAANVVLSPTLNARQQALQQEITARERTVSNAASTDVRQREVLSEFASRPRISRALFCDRVGAVVPEKIVLTALEIEPLTKRFESGKPLQRRADFAVICGVAPAASDVSDFVQNLSALTCCRDVRLANVEKERDGDRLLFRIETAL